MDCVYLSSSSLQYTLPLSQPAVKARLPKMPTTKKFGQPGPNNDKIGGVPTMYYFDFQSRGRGQVVRLMWEVVSTLSPGAEESRL